MKSRIILLTAFVVLLPTFQAWSQQPSAALRIRGVLIKKNGSPLKGKTVVAYPLEADGSPITLISMDAEGKIGGLWNPKADTDNQGRFVISVPRITRIIEQPVTEVCLAVNPPSLRLGQVMVVTIHYIDPNKAAERALKALGLKNDKLPILRKDSDVVRIRMDEKTDEIDLGQIIVK